MAAQDGWRVEEWLDEPGMRSTSYADYWNDREEEKKKEWYVLDGDFARMEAYLHRVRLPEDLTRALDVLQRSYGRTLSGVGIDLAAGNLWAVPRLLAAGTIEKLFCLEFSRHRLLDIGPVVLDHYQVPRDRVVLVRGSFYDLRVANQSLDFVFMSQAFHHADEPERLLAEICRVLKPNGVVILLGEHVMPLRMTQVRQAIKFLVSRLVPGRWHRRLFGRQLSVPRFYSTEKQLFPPDPIMGDHFYSVPVYRRMFHRAGFRVTRLGPDAGHFQSFVLVRGTP